MKLNGVKINKKNFWLPLISVIIISIFMFLILISFVIGSSFEGGKISYIKWFFSERFFIFLLYSLIFSIPPFFIIQRLLSKEPKKVFKIEFLRLSIIYSLVFALIMFFGLAAVGPMGMSKLFYLLLILAPVPFVFLWIFTLTISLYFYYKKNNFFKK